MNLFFGEGAHTTKNAIFVFERHNLTMISLIKIEATMAKLGDRGEGAVGPFLTLWLRHYCLDMPGSVPGTYKIRGGHGNLLCNK